MKRASSKPPNKAVKWMPASLYRTTIERCVKCSPGKIMMSDETTLNFYEHYSVPELPHNWTIQRAGRMRLDKFRWRLFNNGKITAITKSPCTMEDAFRYARAYVNESKK